MDFSAPNLEIQMECYEGPLGVLISLIKKNKVSIWDIPISLITEKFLEYVEVARELQLKVAEDFIEMASLLIYIKSRMLLPSDANGDGDGDGDPREELVERILAYERLKGMVHNIRSQPLLDEDCFLSGIKAVNGDEDFSLMQLCDVFFEILRSGSGYVLEVRDLKPTLEEKLALLRDLIASSGLYVWNYHEEPGQMDKVATILALLELTKLKEIQIMQRRPFGAITAKKRAIAPLPLSGN